MLMLHMAPRLFEKWQDLHREFDASIPYMVSRVMTGYVEEVLAATDTLIITGDIVMDEMDVSKTKTNHSDNLLSITL